MSPRNSVVQAAIARLRQQELADAAAVEQYPELYSDPVWQARFAARAEQRGRAWAKIRALVRAGGQPGERDHD